MVIKPIKTEAEHGAALREIERLWGAAEGTREGDQLEVLATLVEAYERAHFSIDVPDPIGAIKVRLEHDGAPWAAEMACPQGFIHNICAYSSSTSLAMVCNSPTLARTKNPNMYAASTSRTDLPSKYSVSRCKG